MTHSGRWGVQPDMRGAPDLLKLVREEETMGEQQCLMEGQEEAHDGSPLQGAGERLSCGLAGLREAAPA